MKGTTTLALGSFATILVGGILLVQILGPSHVAAPALYSIVILYCWLFEGTKLVVAAGLLCSVLTFADVLLPDVRLDDVSGINRIVSLVVVWVSTALVSFAKSSMREVETAKKNLEVESDKLEAAIEHAPNAMIMIDEKGLMVMANRQAEILFGYPRRRLIGESVEMLVPRSSRTKHANLRSRFLSDPNSRTMRSSRELKARRKDGTEVDVEIGLSPIASASGTLVMTSIVDITERKANAALIEEQHRLKADKLSRELELAERIQTSILPRAPLAPNVEIAARMIPASEVGGDYYDVLPVPDGCWLAIGDVSGHGLDAGLMSLMIQSATSAILRSSPNIAPPVVLAGVNATLHDNIRRRLDRDDFVTYSLLRYRQDGRVSHCGAHEDILVWRSKTKKVERYATEGSWLAIGSHVVSRSREILLRDGDIMVLMTDGILESRDEAGRMLGMDTATKLLASHADLSTEALVDAMLEAALTWSGKPVDDMTVMALRHRSADQLVS